VNEEGEKVTMPLEAALAVLVAVEVLSPQSRIALMESPGCAEQLESVAVTLAPTCANDGAVRVQAGGTSEVTVIACDANCVVSAIEVAVSVTVGGLGTVPGAV
jgi:hypothetical protein